MFWALISRVVAVIIITGLTIADVEHYWGSKSIYNAECPANVSKAVVAFPASLCDPRGFIMCSYGKAIAINKCGINQRFNNATGWCDLATNVPLPPGCGNNVTENKYAVSCRDPGATYVAHKSTCKKYIWCLQGGINYTMDCPSMSIFIKEHEKCMYVTEPYLAEIPPQSFAECQAKDPIIFNTTTTS